MGVDVRVSEEKVVTAPVPKQGLTVRGADALLTILVSKEVKNRKHALAPSA